MTEFVRVVNNKDRFLKSRPRGDYLPGQFVRIAAVLVFRTNGRILLSQVSHKKKTDPLKWSYSAAGHIDDKETTRSAVFRELYEELGIISKSAKFIGKTRVSGKGFHHIFKIISDAPVRPDKNEVEAVREFFCLN